jgi:hypothetical protein
LMRESKNSGLTSQDSLVYSATSSPMSPPSCNNKTLKKIQNIAVCCYLAGSSIVCPLSIMLNKLETSQFKSFFIQITINVGNPRIEESVKLIDPGGKTKS